MGFEVDIGLSAEEHCQRSVGYGWRLVLVAKHSVRDIGCMVGLCYGVHVDNF